jgi:tetratricopeptide (TPR) repeat protein
MRVTNAADLLSIAWQHHQAGALGQAEEMYRQIVAIDPHHADAWHRLGVAVYQQGRHLEAIPLIARAIELAPGDPAMYCHLGAAQGSAGELAAAVESFHQALSIDSADPQAWFNLAAALAQLDRPAEAIDGYQRALQAKPDFVQAWFNLGNVLRDSARNDEAIYAYEQAVHFVPDYAEAYNNLGSLFQRFGRLSEATAALRQALRAQPNYPRAKNNLAVVLTEEHEFDQAVELLQQVIADQPDFAEPYNNLGVALMHRGELDAALAWVEQSLIMQPDSAEAHKNRAIIWLFQGDYERGWREFEWRWKSKDFPPNPYPQPYWNGQPLPGGTLLLHAEQGLGDTIQFVRFAAAAGQLTKRTILVCPPPLVTLLGRCGQNLEVLPQGAPLPPIDAQASLMSLPGLLRTLPQAGSGSPPYLQPAADLVEQWRAELSGYAGLKVGIVWQGNPNYRGDQFRSVRLAEFLPLAEVAGATFFSLQKGFGGEQVAEIADRLPLVDLSERLDDEAGPFMDTAAVMANLDLVITTDTAAAHLAGALAVPVWVALAHVPEWRWLLGREDCPWYPSMRLFRQVAPGDWPSVFGRMAAELGAMRDQER